MSEAASPTRTTHAAPPLDDVMLAMDVVDTLRRRERLVARELDEAGRADEMKQRLRDIYAQQGIEVPDHVIEQGVSALREERFTYKPPESSLATRLAHIYVSRSRWGKWLGGIFGIGVVGAAANYFAFMAPDAALPEDLQAQYQTVLELTKTDYARSRAKDYLDAGNAALALQETDYAREALDSLQGLERELRQEYTLQVVNRPGQRSGVWRIPDVNTQARNYYLIVEAVDSSGRNLRMSIENEETGQADLVSSWGLRVEKNTFEMVARDKRDDGIIQNDRVGYKPRGHLKPRYEMPTNGAAITSW